ncbi:hypothetical protein LCGC14_0239220 [marine sediment metagenome]|uniref:Polysaccharide chain length determinant N-terminal domain-containing protein n=1 Tax=marine sediment metagenome TaxID=412755 RepID=A0A0F9U867_9ZZZZ|nr:hypothetical protein [Phycisphaerae bacterium]HDZ44679.1 hypothetical protein [Phycisphaerae bacterium]
MSEKNNTATFRDKMRVLFRWRSLFFFSAAFLAAALLLLAHVVPPQYKAATKFENRISVVLPERGLEGVTSSESLEETRQTLRQRLTGRKATRAVAEELGLFEGLPTDDKGAADAKMGKQQIVAGIQGRLDVLWDAQSREVDLVSLTYTSSDAELAFKVPNALVKYYMTTTSADTIERLEQSYAFLVEQSDKFRDRVGDLTKRKIDLETEYVGLMEETQLDIVRREQQAKADLDAIRRLRNIAQQKYNRLMAMKEELEQTDRPLQIIKGPNPELERLGAELREYKIELDLAMTLQHMTREHPAIKTLLVRIAIMEERIRNTPPEIILQTMYGTVTGAESYAAQVAAAQSEVEILSAEYDRVESQIKGYQNMMQGYKPARQEYAKLLAEMADMESKAVLWEQRRREVGMALAAEQADLRTKFETMELADKPFRPSFPAVNHVLAVTLLGSIAFGSLAVFFWNAKDRTIATAEQAAKAFAVPVVGTISQIVTRKMRHARAVWRWLVVPLVVAVVLAVLAALAASVIVKLQHPDRYQQWQSKWLKYGQTQAVVHLGRTVR